MRQLLPTPLRKIDAYDAYRPVAAAGRSLRVNMVASADGAATDERGHTAGLGGEGDKTLFFTLRALADAIVVGAGTVRSEHYGPHRLRPGLADRRKADGRPQPAPVVVITASLDLDLSSRLFTEATTPSVILTCAGAPRERRRAAAKVARVLQAGDDRVDLPAGLGLLHSELGLGHLLCEGGPTLNAELFAADVVDELCLTVTPTLVGGHGPRILREPGARVGLDLVAACEQDGELYLRYRVQRDPAVCHPQQGYAGQE